MKAKEKRVNNYCQQFYQYKIKLTTTFHLESLST